MRAESSSCAKEPHTIDQRLIKTLMCRLRDSFAHDEDPARKPAWKSPPSTLVAVRGEVQCVDEIGRPTYVGCRDIHVCSTPVHQERIILAAHSFDTLVAHTHLKRTTPAHPEPARVETATCPLDGRFHSTDRRRSQEARSMGPCGVHVQRMNSGHPWSAWIARQGRGSQFWDELDWGKSC